jgi:putative aldouronate transport system permease protein
MLAGCLTGLKKDWQKHLLMFPAIVIIFIFSYIPMAGIVMAFQQYYPNKGYFGSPWIGLSNFKYLLAMPNAIQVVKNTLILSILKITTGLAFSVCLALFLNEIRIRFFKSAVQSMTLFPFFLSWVILGGIVKDIVDYDGIINTVLLKMGLDRIPFRTSPGWFIIIILISNIWKDSGYYAIIITTALASIDPALYEAATIDGAGRMQKLLRISLPGVGSIVAMLCILAMGGVLNAGFDQIFNMYNIQVMPYVDIIDTYVYRIGLVGGQYGIGTAVGLFKSVVGLILLNLSYKLAEKYAGYRVF